MKPALNWKDPESRTQLLIRIAGIWQALVAVASAAGAGLIWLLPDEKLAVWLKVVISILLAAYGILSVLDLFWIRKREFRGRFTSLALNYLLFLFCLFAGMQVLGIFTGIDALAGTFGRGIPFLAGVFAGYLVSAFGDNFSHHPDRQQLFRRIGKWIMIGFFVIFLFRIGLLDGLAFIARQFIAPLPFVLLFGALVSFGMILIMWRQPTALAFNTKTRQTEVLNGWLFLSPNLLGFLIFFAGPLLFSLFISFTNSDGFGQRDWVGLQNYGKIFTLTVAELDTPDQPVAEAIDVSIFDELFRFDLFGKSFLVGAADKLFWIALRNTIVFVLLALPLSVIPAILLAAILNSKIPGMKFFRAVYFLPSIAATVGVALIWQWLYNAAVGYINYSITSVITFINTAFSAGIVDPQIKWLSSTDTALLAVVIMSAWQWIGYNTVLFLAGMQNVPKELYEAATVDGAGAWRRFWSITLPLLAPTTFFVLTTQIISALQLFEQVYVLIPTEPPGGPNNATLSLVLYLYQKGFQRFQQGYASAVAWVLFILIFAVTLIQFRRQRKGDGAYNA